MDGKTYTGKDVFSRDISRGDEVTEKAYRALNGEYKLYTGDIGDNITSVMMIPAGIIISIFLIYEQREGTRGSIVEPDIMIDEEGKICECQRPCCLRLQPP